MKRVKWLFTGLFFLSVNICPAQKSASRYIQKFLPLAKELSGEWGIPTSIILGVSMLESGSGTSVNCRQLNNYFGVKGRNHLKKRHTKYKQYASAKESFRDFCMILSKKTFYYKLKNNTNYKMWLEAMNNHHYAGAKLVWIHRIKLIIIRYELSQYDNLMFVSK